MKNLLLLCVAVLATLSACKTVPDYGRPLPEGAPALIPLAAGEPRPDFRHEFWSKAEIMPALDQSIAWTRKKSSPQWFPIEGITHDRALRSLERFKALLNECRDAGEFQRRLTEEYQVFKSAGWDGRGNGVLYTAYCTPILEGSRKRQGDYKHPLYALPKDLVKTPTGEILGQQTEAGVQPYPTRRLIEASGLLEHQNLELAWLKDPLDAFIAHVNGSAFIRLPDGSLFKLGYAGKNGRAYTSLGGELVADKQLPKDGVSLRAIREWARKHPEKLQDYLDRNDSFVFFTPIEGNPHGSLNVPVTANRSLATDKRLFPRGALVYVEGRLGSEGFGGARLEHFMLDQDTGGAIRTAGRADVYLGVGEEAERIAGATRTEGQLYYLFLAR